MSYKKAFKYIMEDYKRYYSLASRNGGGRIFLFLKILVHERGFIYSFFLRLSNVKGILMPIFYIIHHHLSTKYGLQIPRQTCIGPGLYLGHGLGIVINGSAVIGSNVSIGQFCTIGSSEGKAATIEDNVQIHPGVCVVGDILLSHHSVVGAGAVVTKTVPPYAVVAGVPAKIVKYINK